MHDTLQCGCRGMHSRALVQGVSMSGSFAASSALLLIATMSAVRKQRLETGILGCMFAPRPIHTRDVQGHALGFFPGVQVTHTSHTHEGQIYVGFVNWTLMLLCVAVVVGFQADSTKLGNAYGARSCDCCQVYLHYLLV
jgi:K+ transporter